MEEGEVGKELGEYFKKREWEYKGLKEERTC